MLYLEPEQHSIMLIRNINLREVWLTKYPNDSVYPERLRIEEGTSIDEVTQDGLDVIRFIAIKGDQSFTHEVFVSHFDKQTVTTHELSETLGKEIQKAIEALRNQIDAADKGRIW